MTQRRPPFPADSRADQRARPRAARDRPADHRSSRPRVREARQGGARRPASGVQDARRPVVIYPASGTGAWEAALVNTLSPGDRVLMCRDRPFRHAVAARWRAKLGLEVEFIPATGATAPIRTRSRARCAPTREQAIKAVCVVHNETSTGVDLAHRRSAQGDRSRRASGAVHGRHDLLARLDRLPARRMGRRRHRRRLAEGPDAAARACRSTRSRDKALAASQDTRSCRAVVLGLGRDAHANKNGYFPVHAGDQPALRPARSAARCC